MLVLVLQEVIAVVVVVVTLQLSLLCSCLPIWMLSVVVAAVLYSFLHALALLKMQTIAKFH